MDGVVDGVVDCIGHRIQHYDKARADDVGQSCHDVYYVHVDCCNHRDDSGNHHDGCCNRHYDYVHMRQMCMCPGLQMRPPEKTGCSAKHKQKNIAYICMHILAIHSTQIPII